jgi:prepilin-type N-terminal cleavage/methylation domain-containing protein
MTQRRGFTLVEVVIALVIMGIVTGAIYRLLNTNQRLALAQAEQVSLQSNVRTGSLAVPSELRELNTVLGSLDATQNDVIDAQDNAIEYRAMRGLGFVCQAPAGNQLRLARSSWTGLRDPIATRDGLYLFVDGDVDDDADDAWAQLSITAVATAANACGATAGITLTVAPVPPAVAIPAVPVNTPVRLFETMRLELYADAAGEWWLGARSISVEPNLQPVLGPLTNDGFDLDYLDSNGNPTVDKTAINSIQVTVRGLTDDAVRAGGSGAMGHPEEALVTQVLLRNSIRP